MQNTRPDTRYQTEDAEKKPGTEADMHRKTDTRPEIQSYRGTDEIAVSKTVERHAADRNKFQMNK